MRRNGRLFAFEPNSTLWIVLASWALIVGTFYLSFQVITISRTALQFITFGIIGVMVLGIAAPTLWVGWIEKRGVASLGITTKALIPSLLLSTIFAGIQWAMTLRHVQLPAADRLIPLITMSLAVGLFENIFFRGWIQLHVEKCFGIIPGILVSATLYSLYHVGYGMGSSEMFMLLVIGLVYSSIFRLTANIFILFPLLTPMGALFTNIQDGLVLPFEATYGFVNVIAFSALLVFFLNRAATKQNERAA